MRIINHKYSTIFCYTLSLQSEARIVSLVIYFACSDPEPERILPRRRSVNLIINRPPELLDEECTPLLWETISSDPPQYDDINISARCPERPPSYEEIDKD
ncbi:uncharacterized protein LOC126815134 [Patella vulgata]|uniref:uncharacterized protein LOC126815134 n=1 Tax=Patella vulgata TaxID=6465 RepID=UPI0024A82484|nr:uncharacterized protein LOC126815134 [Patella vulgata]